MILSTVRFNSVVTVLALPDTLSNTGVIIVDDHKVDHLSETYTASRHKLAVVISWPPSPNLEIAKFKTNLKAGCNHKWSIIITFMFFIVFEHCTKTYLSVWPN